MKKNKYIIIIVILLFFSLLTYNIGLKRGYSETSDKNLLNSSNIKEDQLIAHAGGIIDGMAYTNSLEAIENSYKKGFRYMEIDFEWTSDGKPVLIHDWDTMVDFIYSEEARVLSHDEFKKLPTRGDLTSLDLDDLIEWLDNHRDVHIITDTTNDNIKLLSYIKEKYPKYLEHFIPQIYKFEEYEDVKSLGYENIILTLYMSSNTNEEILNFIREKDLYGVTIDKEKIFDENIVELLRDEDIKIFAHTVNFINGYRILKDMGIYGVYTDYLYPEYFK